MKKQCLTFGQIFFSRRPLNKEQNVLAFIGLRDTWKQLEINEWIYLAMGFILIWDLRDVFQCEFLAFNLAEMFKDTLWKEEFFLLN